MALGFLLGACAPNENAAPPLPAHPARVLSLDYCADQFVLKLADRAQIVGLSPEAEKPFSYMRAAAKGLPKVRPSAEEAIARRPDLVVRSYGGGASVTSFLARAGVPVAQLSFAETFDGVRADIMTMAKALGHPERGAALAAEMDARLAAARRDANGPRALYLAEGGATTGPGSLVHDVIEAAGWRNFVETPGWAPIPLERLAYDEPDLYAPAGFDDGGAEHNAWSSTRHPVLRAKLKQGRSVALDGAWTACGGWFVIEAVERLREARP